ncbi:hypothetical protein ACGFRB_12015 [Streptomyces sp. NPDC048718]|uniref:hypothetical protein n=1 Tax=Streptomyces sp. NPDC048718 TaxID=3365587 RepID=UPI003721078E
MLQPEPCAQGRIEGVAVDTGEEAGQGASARDAAHEADALTQIQDGMQTRLRL